RQVLERLYERMPARNFSSDLLEQAGTVWWHSNSAASGGMIGIGLNGSPRVCTGLERPPCFQLN
ncbi:MAG: hypothetical protein ABI604_18055, partial [Nitrospirota bacterium]